MNEQNILDGFISILRGVIREEVAQAIKTETMPQEGGETLYTAKEFCAKYQVVKSTLWSWCNRGIIEKVAIGGRTYYKAPKPQE